MTIVGMPTTKISLGLTVEFYVALVLILSNRVEEKQSANLHNCGVVYHENR
jgi:hypothetical protein